MSKKTFKVVDFKERINYQLSLPSLSRDAKQALCITLEAILQQTGNYHGFQFINEVKSEVLDTETNDFYTRCYY